MLQLRRLFVPVERRIIGTRRCRQIIRGIQTMPKRGDRGTLYDLLASKMIYLLCSQVVVAMSGGVDSSVTARLLAEKVQSFRIHTVYFLNSLLRTTTYPLYSCETGTRGMNPVRTRAASGRRIGKTCIKFVGCLAFLVRWSLLPFRSVSLETNV